MRVKPCFVKPCFIKPCFIKPCFLPGALALLLTLHSPHSPADFSRSAAYDPPATQDRYRQRQLYLDALHLVRTSQFTRLQKLKPQLRTYALYPYLEYTEMRYRISRYSEGQVLAFVAQNTDTPLTQPLLQHWLGSLARRGDWQTFVANYHRVTPTGKLACQYGYGLYKVGRVDEAMAEATKLWTVGFSQPDECDPVFHVWRGKGVPPETAWRRLSLSLKQNERALARYLLRYIAGPDKTHAANFRLVHRKPENVKRYRLFRQDNRRNREIVLHGVRRLAATDPADALASLRVWESRLDFEPAALEDAYAHIGIRLVGRTDDPAALDDLPVNLRQHPILVEAGLRQSLRLRAWGRVIPLIELLPNEMRNSSRWRYWRARVLGLSADEAARQPARDLLAELSETRSFYGFMAADILQSRYNYQDEPATVTFEQMLSLEAAPGIQRALELFALGERSQARREWRFSTADFTPAESQVAAKVALRRGWYQAAIQTMINAGAWNRLDFRFPLAYQDSFIRYAQGANIPVQWSLAVARQESAFMPDARSPAGALGIMQLMPGTAKRTARQLGITYAGNGSLMEPDLNIRLGTGYLGELLRRYGNNRILASAAYNAGPARVDRWLDPAMPFDVWVEVIPFNETRAYVQNVLMFSSIYSRRMNEHQPLIYRHERNGRTD